MVSDLREVLLYLPLQSHKYCNYFCASIYSAHEIMLMKYVSEMKLFKRLPCQRGRTGWETKVTFLSHQHHSALKGSSSYHEMELLQV
jgi:hypothetical protein